MGQARHVFTARDDEDDDPAMPDDLAARLRRLTAYLAFGVWLLGAAKCWDVDLAFLRTLGEIQLWPMTAGKLPEGTEVVSLGDVTKSTILFALTVAAWRHLATFFAVFVFPRMPDDPGVRFAALTLSRYFVLGLGLLAGLSAIHLGLDKSASCSPRSALASDSAFRKSYPTLFAVLFCCWNDRSAWATS